MRKPSLSLETFVTALAVLGAGTSVGCSRSERATAAPDLPAAQTPVVAPGPPGAPALQPTAQLPRDEAPPVGSSALPEGSKAPAADPKPLAASSADGAPKRRSPLGSSPVNAAPTAPPKNAPTAPTASAACANGSCSPDMKKGSGN